ncbi:uncharacterized protein LOC106153272 [Lingula anatina]|uniref:Uncharacterized protein LOC106153272 n=1 Tax=Lingula anatina TaxID=7574 RepID=A0A1S3H9A7_LINAN|nr:uncharacterized protein LOC106153272 [Lingula anatina]|eukprot:XP_013382593.1 uncharacterized protein LOC106153272 [Lingula anatina]
MRSSCIQDACNTYMMLSKIDMMILRRTLGSNSLFSQDLALRYICPVKGVAVFSTWSSFCFGKDLPKRERRLQIREPRKVIFSQKHWSCPQKLDQKRWLSLGTYSDNAQSKMFANKCLYHDFSGKCACNRTYKIRFALHKRTNVMYKDSFFQQERKYSKSNLYLPHLTSASILMSSVKAKQSYNCQQERTKMKTAKDLFGFSLNDKEVRRVLECTCREYEQNEEVLEKSYTNFDSGEKRNARENLLREASLVEKYLEFIEKENELKEMDKMLKEDGKEDKDIAKMLKKEKEENLKAMDILEKEILTLLVPPNTGPTDDCDVIMEFSSGAGGQEAMLFCAEIFSMYQRYAAYKGWIFDIIRYETQQSSSSVVLSKASVAVSGPGVYRCLKYEGGVHRVQRIPLTEKGSRIHTSTMSVAVLPQPSDIDVQLNSSDLEIQTMHASGPGGQHVNKTESAVRIKHIPTGLVVSSQRERNQHQNQSLALKMLRSMLYNKELEERQSKFNSQRKLQVGGMDRSEKIRTYNFPQDRITDHRVKETFHGVEDFMEGGVALDDIVEILQQEAMKERLAERLKEYENNQQPKKKSS